MPVIDLRNADIFISDGTVNTATTSLSANALKGDSVVTLTSTAGLDVGQGFTLNGGMEYYVVAGINGSDVTIEPSLTTNYASGAAVAGVSNMLEVKIGEGTLTYNERRAVTYILNRGRIYGVKLGDDAPVEVSMQYLWEFLRAGVGDPPTVEEALKQIGAAVEWVSSDTDPCNPYCVDISICHVPPCGDTERINLKFFRWEELNHDLKAATVDVRGNANVAFADVTHSTS